MSAGDNTSIHHPHAVLAPGQMYDHTLRSILNCPDGSYRDGWIAVNPVTMYNTSILCTPCASPPEMLGVGVSTLADDYISAYIPGDTPQRYDTPPEPGLFIEAYISTRQESCGERQHTKQSPKSEL
jgi:hypothetical protein